MITVVVVDDHPLVRHAVSELLDASRHVHVVGLAENGLQAIAVVQELAPDVVVMDISMPMMDGLQATAALLALNLPVRVVVLSMHASPALVARALEHGATGYLHKPLAGRELVPAVIAASQGRRYVRAGSSPGPVA